MTFEIAVRKTRYLENAYKNGLKALRAEDRIHIDAENTRQLRGSVDIDTANRTADPSGNRWDFGIAYRHSNRDADVVYWVKTHTASDSQVSVVLKKADWLLQWFKGHGKYLATFEKDILWVSSGRTTFTLSSPQRKQMAALGLRPCGGKLRIRDLRSD